VRLREIPSGTYAREVLPLTAPLWSGRRSFEQYVAQTLQAAQSRYGRRHYRTVGLYDGSTCVSSFKRYERTLHHGATRAPAIGFGAVFTPLEYRGRGYASVMLAAALDEARAGGFEVAYLFSDIRPQFYAAIGFRACACRQFSLDVATLPATRLDLANLSSQHWAGIRRLFDLSERGREAGFLRNAAVWESIATRLRHSSENPDGNAVNLVARQGNAIAAYVLGARLPRRDAYVLDEFAVVGKHAATVLPALLRAAAGDLRRITGWLPPGNARRLLPKPTLRKRRNAIFMMAALRPQGRRLVEAVLASGDDFGWATDHV
jgi:GNAT superfamily N-acetyltransferase